MLRSYLLTAVRNLLKNKLNASINIIGLSVAFTCSILLFLMVSYEFSFDRFQVKADRLYQVYNLAHEEKGDEKIDAQPYPMVNAFKADVPGIVRATTTLSAGNDINYNGKEVEQRITVVDSDFFRMFSFPVVSGNTSNPLGSLNNAVISQSRRHGYFWERRSPWQDDQVKIIRGMVRSGGLGRVAGCNYQLHDTIRRAGEGRTDAGLRAQQRQLVFT